MKPIIRCCFAFDRLLSSRGLEQHSLFQAERQIGGHSF
jgi:hypothetical protein